MKNRTSLPFLSEDPSAVPLPLLIKYTSINHNTLTNRNIQLRLIASHITHTDPHACLQTNLLLYHHLIYCVLVKADIYPKSCFSGCLVNTQLSNEHVGTHCFSLLPKADIPLQGDWSTSYRQSWMSLLASLENYNRLQTSVWKYCLCVPLCECMPVCVEHKNQ